MKSLVILTLSIFLLTACGVKNQTTVVPQQTSDTEKTMENTTQDSQKNSEEMDKADVAAKEKDMDTTLKAESTSAETENDGDDDDIVVETKTTNDEPKTVSAKIYTSSEVAQHNNGKDCWLILDAKVYDVTEFIPNHPGGEAILRGCGKDATRMFAGHPESAKAMKEKFYIGNLQK